MIDRATDGLNAAVAAVTAFGGPTSVSNVAQRPPFLSLTHEALGEYGVVDCGAYVNIFMLAARSLGVACIAQAALATRPNLVRQHFGLSSDQRIVCGISFGYADESHPVNAYRTGRADLAEVGTWVGP